MNLTTVITDPGVGGTFLTWSIHFLAGHAQHYNYKNNSWISLPHDPLTSTNAHQFLANQVCSNNDIDNCLDNLQKNPTDTFHTIYFHHFREYPYSNLYQDTRRAIQKILPLSKKTVILSNQIKNSLYFTSQNLRGFARSFNDSNKKYTSFIDQQNDFLNFFFKDSLEFWHECELTDPWDLREFFALNMAPHDISILPLIEDLSHKHFDIDCMEFFNTGDQMILDLMAFLEVPINPDRLASWKNVYYNWRKLHYNRLNFLWYFDKIITYIINGHYMDLSRFNLDLVQEAAIQHELIYKHNLNLKTWQLEKFTDTIQLHQLLESNIHDLSKHKINY